MSFNITKSNQLVLPIPCLAKFPSVNRFSISYRH